MRGWRVRLLCDWTEGASWAIQSLRVFRQELVCWPRRLSTCHNHDGSAEPAPTPLGPHSITSKACQLFGRYLVFHVCTPDFIVLYEMRAAVFVPDLMLTTHRQRVYTRLLHLAVISHQQVIKSKSTRSRTLRLFLRKLVTSLVTYVRCGIGKLAPTSAGVLIFRHGYSRLQPL